VALIPGALEALVSNIRSGFAPSSHTHGTSGIEDGAVTISDVKTGDETSLPADMVVLAMGVRPDRPDYDALRKAYGDKLILVGDSGRPGQIYDALHSGYDKAFVY
jgi:hypothetical protein